MIRAICHIVYNQKQYVKVWDHYHLIGNFRGAEEKTTMNVIWFENEISRYVPVFSHNFVRDLGADEEEICIIPSNREKYISFYIKIDKIMLRFLDSFRFVSSCLEKLASFMDPATLHAPRIERGIPIWLCI